MLYSVVYLFGLTIIPEHIQCKVFSESYNSTEKLKKKAQILLAFFCQCVTAILTKKILPLLDGKNKEDVVRLLEVISNHSE